MKMHVIVRRSAYISCFNDSSLQACFFFSFAISVTKYVILQIVGLPPLACEALGRRKIVGFLLWTFYTPGIFSVRGDFVGICRSDDESSFKKHRYSQPKHGVPGQDRISIASEIAEPILIAGFND